MNELATRKQLLIAESELNRVRLTDDLLMAGGSIGALTDRILSFGSIASSVAGLLAGLTAVRPAKPPPGRNWLHNLVSGASLLSGLWQYLHRR